MLELFTMRRLIAVTRNLAVQTCVFLMFKIDVKFSVLIYS